MADDTKVLEKESHRPLTEREAAFVKRAAEMAPTAAAKAAGYADSKESFHLLQKPNVIAALLTELQKKEIKLSTLRVQAKAILSGVMTDPRLKKEGGPNWSDKVAAARVVMDLLKKEGKTLAEAAEEEDVAEETVALAKKVLAAPVEKV